MLIRCSLILTTKTEKPQEHDLEQGGDREILFSVHVTKLIILIITQRYLKENCVDSLMLTLKTVNVCHL